MKVQTLSAYERGVNNPPIEILKELSLQYGVTIDSLVFGENVSPSKRKTTEEYVRQLVESAVFLDLDFIVREDPYGAQNKYYLDMNVFPFEAFDAFVEKWVTLEELQDNGTITTEEYEQLLMARLCSLKLIPKKEETK